MAPTRAAFELMASGGLSSSGCGSVGRAVASNTKDRQFKSSHQQKIKFILNKCLLSTVY